MVAQVDIVTGKKTILDYILKPILKTKQYTFSER
jgi:adhesin transport system membrane fusion protein